MICHSFQGSYCSWNSWNANGVLGSEFHTEKVGYLDRFSVEIGECHEILHLEYMCYYL